MTVRPSNLIAMLALAVLGGAGLGLSLLGERRGVHGQDAPSADPGRAQAQSLSHAFQQGARRVRPSVLNITTERWIGGERPLMKLLREFFPNAGEQRQRPQIERSYGTGFVVRPDGLALTNNHVVSGAKRVLVRLHDGVELSARVVGTDRLSDLAVLALDPRPDGEDYVPVSFGDSDALEVGDWVLAAGNPFGLDQTVTAGIVSAKGRSRVGIAAYEDFIQTDAAINPGSSGGPLLDLDGRVVGVTTAIFSRSGGYQGIGFAIPIAMARQVMEGIIAEGRVVRGWLGIQTQSASPELLRRLGFGERHGSLVSGVLPGGPAEQAGLRAGDLVVGLGGEPVEDSTRLLHLAAQAAVGQPTVLRYVRAGVEGETTVIPDERLAEEDEPGAAVPAPLEPRGVGISARNLVPELASYFGYPPDAEGVVITQVEPGSRAAQSGIRPGMILVELNRRPIRSLADLDAAAAGVDPAEGIVLRVWDGEGAAFVLVR